VHGDSADLAVDDLTLAGMKAGPELEPHFLHRFVNCAGTVDRAANTVVSNPPSETPMIAARREPTASITARMSPSLHLGDPLHAIREPGAALVEENQARERAQRPEEVGRRAVPGEFERRDHPADDEDKVERPIADHRKGNVDVTALRVTNLGCVHGRLDLTLEVGRT
jgi:hypothetical protein